MNKIRLLLSVVMLAVTIGVGLGCMFGTARKAENVTASKYRRVVGRIRAVYCAIETEASRVVLAVATILLLKRAVPSFTPPLHSLRQDTRKGSRN